MPRLDNVRVGTWRDLRLLVDRIERSIDEELRADWDIAIEWFDVLTALQRLDGIARPLDIAAELGVPASSISRRLDRLEEEGWIARHRHTDVDKRAVDVELTKSGRRLWREMNVTYRRAVQAHFATHLADEDIASFRSLIDALAEPGDDVD
ncbi:MAG: MarR family winged helix-turn-helix transcriptional regulator [Ilumatobacter sp.]